MPDYQKIADFTADGTAEKVRIGYGGDYMLSCPDGMDLGGGTLTINIYSQDGVKMKAPADLVFTDVFEPQIISVGAQTSFEVVLSGSTSPTDCAVWLSHAGSK